jgi:hypothetical protein
MKRVILLFSLEKYIEVSFLGSYFVSAFSNTLLSDAWLIPLLHTHSAILGLSSYFLFSAGSAALERESIGIINEVHTLR